MGIADFSLLLPVFLSIDDNSSVAVLFAVYQDAVWLRLTTVEFSIDFHFPPYWRSKGRRRCSWWFVRATNPPLQLTLLCGACEVFTKTLRLRVLNQEEGESTNIVCNKLNGETHCLVERGVATVQGRESRKVCLLLLLSLSPNYAIRGVFRNLAHTETQRKPHWTGALKLLLSVIFITAAIHEYRPR